MHAYTRLPHMHAYIHTGAVRHVRGMGGNLLRCSPWIHVLPGTPTRAHAHPRAHPRTHARTDSHTHAPTHTHTRTETDRERERDAHSHALTHTHTHTHNY
jgi:hypothetical protein